VPAVKFSLNNNIGIAAGELKCIIRIMITPRWHLTNTLASHCSQEKDRYSLPTRRDIRWYVRISARGGIGTLANKNGCKI
jgi:hypothetical protein